MKNKEKILYVFNRYEFFLIFFLIFSPIFISLDFSNGIKFDACVNNLYSFPSIPISFVVLLTISVVNYKKIILNKQLLILFFLITFYIILNLYYETTRSLIVGLGMMLPLMSFYTFKNFFQKVDGPYNIMYLSLFSVIVVKFIFDLNYIYINDINTGMKFNTWQYIIDNIVVYSFQDYFPFIYFLATILSINNIINTNMVKRSVLLIIVSNLAILDPQSRLFLYGVYLIPFLYIFFITTKFRLSTYFYLFMVVSLIISMAIGLMDFKLDKIGFVGLDIRNNLIYGYFNDFKFINIILPFLNEHRRITLGSFHNELVEIFSFFGFTIIYYYYLIMKMYSGVNKEYQLISFLLMFIIVIGALIQINISNPYVGIMLGMVLAVLSSNNRTEIENAKI